MAIYSTRLHDGRGGASGESVVVIAMAVVMALLKDGADGRFLT